MRQTTKCGNTFASRAFVVGLNLEIFVSTVTAQKTFAIRHWSSKTRIGAQQWNVSNDSIDLTEGEGRWRASLRGWAIFHRAASVSQLKLKTRDLRY